MDCHVCKHPLKESRWNADESLKSCPRCSQAHGSQHVYYANPDKFGTTPARASASHPDGVQSHCAACRAQHAPDSVEDSRTLCADVFPQQRFF